MLSSTDGFYIYHMQNNHKKHRYMTSVMGILLCFFHIYSRYDILIIRQYMPTKQANSGICQKRATANSDLGPRISNFIYSIFSHFTRYYSKCVPLQAFWYTMFLGFSKISDITLLDPQFWLKPVFCRHFVFVLQYHNLNEVRH